MNPDTEKTCHCSNNKPVIFQGSLPRGPLYCIQCKKPVSLEDSNIPSEFAENINKWGQLYKSLFTIWRDGIEHREWAKQQLLDEIGVINLDGLKLSQQYNEIRSAYYWMFQDSSDKDYTQPEQCPFCGASMEPMLENDFKVCHSCNIAYPDKQYN